MPDGEAASRTQQDDAPDCRSEDAVVLGLHDAIYWIAFGDAVAPNNDGATAVWDDAERELVRALQIGEVVATGFRHGRGERQEIPAHFWIDAELEPLQSYAFLKGKWSGEKEWEQVRLYRRDIVQRWPSPLSLIQDEPAVDTSSSRPAAIRAEIQADRFYPGKNIKRRGGRPAPWVKSLRKYLRLRLQSGDDILNMSLTDLRVDFLSYAPRNQIRNVPKARSALDEQIKKGRPLVIAEHHKQGQRSGSTEA
jgi:hypothetical protein